MNNSNSPDASTPPPSQSELAQEAKKLIEQKIPLEQILSQFKARGISEEAATTAIHSASKVAEVDPQKVVQQNEGEKSWWSKNWWTIFVIYLIIKYGLRAMSNN